MNTQTHENLHFPLLTEAHYLAAVTKAETTIRDRMQAPRPEDYAMTSANAYRRWFVALVGSGWLAGLVFSFIVSAGHQTAAYGLLFDHLPDKFSHLSPLW